MTTINLRDGPSPITANDRAGRTRCALYARVSTDRQAHKELSIPAQVEAMRQYAAQRDWVVRAERVEPGASAQTADRRELQQLLTDIDSGRVEVDVLLVHKFDRFSRNIYDHVIIKARLQKKKVRLVSVVENIDDSVSGELVENIMASIAQFYSANLSDEVKKGMRQKVIQGGWPHRVPRGYLRTKTEEGSAIEIHPQEGPLMKRAFRLYATGSYSVKALADYLAREGMVSRAGGPIPHAHLRRLLANPFYAGVVKWHEMECPGTHPSLIDRELFDKVQAVIGRRFANPGPNGSVLPGFPLRGIALCSSCRGRMTCERHGTSLYYRCSRQTYRRDLCPGRSCNAKRAHDGVERLCRQLRLEKSMAEQIRQAAVGVIAQRLADEKAKRHSVDQQTAELLEQEMSLTRGFSAGDIAPNQFNQDVAVLRTQRQQLAELVTTAPQSAADLAEGVAKTLQYATSLWDLYAPMNEMNRRTLLNGIFSTIVLDHHGVAGFVLNSPFDVLMTEVSKSKSARELVDHVLDAATAA